MTFARPFLLLSIFVVAVALFGCGDKLGASGRLRVAVVGGKEGAAIKELSKAYKERLIEVVELPYTALKEQLAVALTNAKPDFDVVLVDDPWFPQFSKHFAELSSVPQELLNDILPSSLRLCRDPYGDGVLKALPFVGNSQMLFVRTDLLKRYKVTSSLGTWSGVVESASKITAAGRAATPPEYGYAIRGKSGAPIVTDILPVYWSLGGKILSKSAEGKLSVSIDGPVLEQTFQIYKSLAGSSPPGAVNYDWNEMTADFAAGRVAMELNWPIAIEGFVAKLGLPGEKGVWDILPPPGKDSAGTSMIGNWLLAIPKDSSNRVAAEQFVVWLMQNQHVVAGPDTPPTRKSIYKSFAENERLAYMSKVRDAIENSTARDRTERWGLVEDAFSVSAQNVLAGNGSPASSATEFKKKMEQLFASDK